MDLNPVIVSPSGAVAVDVKIRVEAVPHDPVVGARHLRRPGSVKH
jgi:hypothetical protein